MSRCFCKGRACRGHLACFQPVPDGLSPELCAGVMLSNKLGCAPCDVREFIFQCGRNSRVDLPPRALEQAIVGCIAHESVFEHVTDVGSGTLPENELGLNELV